MAFRMGRRGHGHHGPLRGLGTEGLRAQRILILGYTWFMKTKKQACGCPSDCPCWGGRPGAIIGCNCTTDPEDHLRPAGCRYEDTLEGWTPSWPGVDGPVMVCLTHRGRAPGDAYDDPSVTVPCLDSHLRQARRPSLSRKPHRQAMEFAIEIMNRAAESCDDPVDAANARLVGGWLRKQAATL